jgi:hypothetical protein
MPSDNFKILAQVQPGTSATTIYGAVPANHETIIKGINIVNNHSSAVTINLFIADGATTATEATTILPPVSMAAGSFAIFEGTITMEVGDYLRGIAGSATEITVTVFGDEIDVS